MKTQKKKKPAGRTSGAKAQYVLKLFVAGSTTRSALAINNTKEMCEKHLGGKYTLEIVDIFQQPEEAEHMEIIAVPTLIKSFPKPLRRFIGDMSNTQRLVGELNRGKK